MSFLFKGSLSCRDTQKAEVDIFYQKKVKTQQEWKLIHINKLCYRDLSPVILTIFSLSKLSYMVRNCIMAMIISAVLHTFWCKELCYGLQEFWCFVFMSFGSAEDIEKKKWCFRIYVPCNTHYLLPLLPMPETQTSYRLWPQCISLRQEEGSTGLVISYCHIPGENLPVLH